MSRLLRDIGLASKRINVEVNKAGLQDILGDMGFSNVQGEEVKKLDVFANNQLIYVLKNGMSCAGICSEEEDDIIVFDDELSNKSKYVVLFDPLDGCLLLAKARLVTTYIEPVPTLPAFVDFILYRLMFYSHIYLMLFVLSNQFLFDIDFSGNYFLNLILHLSVSKSPYHTVHNS